MIRTSAGRSRSPRRASVPSRGRLGTHPDPFAAPEPVSRLAGVLVNLISPGPIPGERLDRLLATQVSSRGLTVEEVGQEFARLSPLGRFVEPADIADAVLFLASVRAACITGEHLNVSAGTVTYG